MMALHAGLKAFMDDKLRTMWVLRKIFFQSLLPISLISGVCLPYITLLNQCCQADLFMLFSAQKLSHSTSHLLGSL